MRQANTEFKIQLPNLQRAEERSIYGRGERMKMGRREWQSATEAEENFRNYATETQISVVHGRYMKRRSATEIWTWLALLVKKINGIIKYSKCDGVNIVNAWRPLRQSWKTVEQRRRVRTRDLNNSDQIHHTDSDLSGEDDSISNSSPKAKSARQGKGWVKRLIIRGVNGKGSNKRGIEFDGEGRRARLTRKRRRIARGGWVKYQQQQEQIGEAKETGESGLRAFLRPEERYTTSGGDSSPEHLANRSRADCTSSTPRQFEAFLVDYSDDGEVSQDEKEEPLRYRAHNYLSRRSKASTPENALLQLLPDDLVDKVLGWLPLTSVLHFGSVCRRWQSNLSPENWCKIFHQSPPAWSACPALFTSGNGRRQCAFYDLSLHKWSRIFLDFLPDPACHLLTASGGLLCLCHSGMNSSLFICNPLTKSWRVLPLFDDTRRRAGAMIVHMLVHPTSKAYKVILIGHPTCMSSTTTEVFDSETGIWTALATVPSDGCTLAPSVILRNGILYCLTELPTGLLAFNLARKVWRRLEIKSHFRVLFIFEHRGHILLVARMSARITRLGIWKLRESFPRVWLKVAVMPSDHANFFIKSGRFQCFGHSNFICFGSPRRPQWLIFDLGMRQWTWGSPARELNQDSYNRWFFYEPCLDVQA